MRLGRREHVLSLIGLLQYTLERYVQCIVCYYDVITAEQFTRYQTLYVVLRNLSQVVHTIANICKDKVITLLGTKTFARTTYLFYDCMCREKLGYRTST